MRDIQMLYNGRVFQAAVAYEGSELMELELDASFPYKSGDSVVCFDFKRRMDMRILKGIGSKLIVAPEEAEVFQIESNSKKVFEELYKEESKTFASFKLNVFGTISEDFRTFAVRFTDVSRLGFGFEIDDFTIRLNHEYDSMIILDDETIHPKLVIRYAHIGEKTIRYGAEIHSISTKDLSKLRYFIVTKQFSLV